MRIPRVADRRNRWSLLGWLLPLLPLLLSLLGPVTSWVSPAVHKRPTGRLRLFSNNKEQEPSTTVPASVGLLILPGFGNDESDYFLERAPEGSLVASLVKRGWSPGRIRVLPVRRTDWLRVFLRGALDWKFWVADAGPDRPAFRWYLRRIAAAVHQFATEDENCQVVLIAHSAGGWLARAALGFCGSSGEEADDAAEMVSGAERDADQGESPSTIDLSKIVGMVTLGAPHTPPPPQVMDMTRGALRITHETFPGAYHDELFYITVSGDAVQGVKQERSSPFEPTTATGFAFSSYEAVCGDGEAIGDGVVPQVAAHLEGAIQLDLPGIFHSINEPERWYGSDSVIDQWHEEMLRQLNRASRLQRTIEEGLLEDA